MPKRGYKKKSAVAKLSREVKSIKRELKPEKKYIEKWLASTTLNNTVPTPFFWYLATCSQGNTSTTRDGDNTKLVSVNIRGDIKYILGSTESALVRLMLIVDKRADGTPFLPIQLFEYTTTATGVVNSYRNKKYLERYKVLYDRKFQLQDTILSRQFNINKKLNLPMRYVSNNGDYSDFNGNSLIFLVQCGDMTTGYPVINWQGRVRFIDV